MANTPYSAGFDGATCMAYRDTFLAAPSAKGLISFWYNSPANTAGEESSVILAAKIPADAGGNWYSAFSVHINNWTGTLNIVWTNETITPIIYLFTRLNPSGAVAYSKLSKIPL